MRVYQFRHLGRWDRAIYWCRDGLSNVRGAGMIAAS